MPSLSRPGLYVIILNLCFVLLLASCRSSEEWKTSQSKGDEMKKSGNRTEAIKYYKLAVKQMDESQVPLNKEIACLNQLITLLLLENKGKEADEFANKALSMAERFYGPDHINVMPQVVLLQKTAEKVSDRARVYKCMDRAIELQQSHSPDSQPVMWLLDQYARSRSLSCGDGFDEAKLRQLVRLREKFAAKDDIETTRDKIILASCLNQKGQAQEALEIYASCLQVARQKYKGLLAEVLVNYSKALIKQKQDEKALPLLKEAFTLAGPGKKYNPVLAPEIATELGVILENKHQKAEAAGVYEAMAAQLDADRNEKAEYFRTRLKELKS